MWPAEHDGADDPRKDREDGDEAEHDGEPELQGDQGRGQGQPHWGGGPPRRVDGDARVEAGHGAREVGQSQGGDKLMLGDRSELSQIIRNILNTTYQIEKMYHY